ncbi:MAG: transglutaminase domain-containing protein, partial [Mogibacterium sp.]|nr:transglutaminase domain-containing protein [Mogibacterium sp.]
GAFLDKKLLAHKSTIVFYTKDKSLFSAYSPTLERKLDSCSTMLYGIKHNKSISYLTVVNAKTGKFAYYKVTIKPKYRYSKANDKKFYKKVKRLAKKAKKKKGVKNRARYINNYIINNVKYNSRTAYHNTAYSAMMKGKATCQGYTDLFTIVAREAGLKAETVCGYAWYSRKKDRAYHAWNVVKYGKKWVQLDVTFNDVGSAYKYFMINKKKFNKNHQLDKFYNTKAWKKAHPLK